MAAAVTSSKPQLRKKMVREETGGAQPDQDAYPLRGYETS